MLGTRINKFFKTRSLAMELLFLIWLLIINILNKIYGYYLARDWLITIERK